MMTMIKKLGILFVCSLSLAGCVSNDNPNVQVEPVHEETGVFKTRGEAIQEAVESVGATSEEDVSDLEIVVSDDGTGYIVTFTYEGEEHSVLVNASDGTRALEERIHFDQGESSSDDDNKEEETLEDTVESEEEEVESSDDE